MLPWEQSQATAQDGMKKRVSDSGQGVVLHHAALPPLSGRLISSQSHASLLPPLLASSPTTRAWVGAQVREQERGETLFRGLRRRVGHRELSPPLRGPARKTRGHVCAHGSVLS